MGTKADFYVGRGVDSEWLGSIAWEGKPVAMQPQILTAEDEDTYRHAVTLFLDQRGDGIHAHQGWPWKWDSSLATNYSYALEGDQVWVCCYGSSWWLGTNDEPDHVTLTRKAATFPNMGLVKKLDSGIFVPKPK